MLIVVMSTGQKILTRVGSGQFFCCSGWVGSAIFGLGFGLENFPPKSQILQFFPFGEKKLPQVGSKSTWVKDG